ISTNALMAYSQANVAIASTALTWSAALDRPTVSAFLWPRLDYWSRAQQWSGIERVSSGPELTHSLQRYWHDPAYAEQWRHKRADFVADELCFDGHATERLVELIEQLRAQKRPAA